MQLGIKVLIVPSVPKVGKDSIVVAADMAKAVANIIQVVAVERETMGGNMEEVEVVDKKVEKENINLTTTIPVPVISATSQVILQRIVHMQKILHKC